MSGSDEIYHLKKLSLGADLLLLSFLLVLRQGLTVA